MIDLEQLQLKLEFEEKDWVANETSVSGKFQKSETNLFGLNIPDDFFEKVASKRMLIEHFAMKLDFPEAYDLRNVNNINYTTDIKNQGSCGACVAFALCAVWEAQYKIHNFAKYRTIDLSEAYLFFCSSQKCARGWNFEDALNFALTNGTCDEICFPYTGKQQICQPCKDYPYRMLHIKDWFSIDIDDLQKYTISKHGPLLAGMKVYEDFPYYTGGIYEHTDGDFLGNHAVAVMGYNENEKYWICKNSWGDGWGEDGWFRIRYGECNIDFNPKFKIEIK